MTAPSATKARTSSVQAGPTWATTILRGHRRHPMAPALTSRPARHDVPGAVPGKAAPGTKKAAPREAARVWAVYVRRRAYALPGRSAKAHPGRKERPPRGTAGVVATQLPPRVRPGPAPRKAARNFGGFAKDVALGLPRSVTTTAASTWPAASGRSCASSASRTRRRSSGRRKATAARSGSSARSRSKNLPLGAELRHRRGAVPGAARLPRDLQRDPADRAARLQTTRRCQGGAAFTCGPGRVGSSPVSHQPGAVQG